MIAVSRNNRFWKDRSYSFASKPYDRKRLCPNASINGVQNYTFEDRFISRLMKSCAPSDRSGFPKLLNHSLERLRTVRMPTTRQEDFRFTDISPILQSDVKVVEDQSISDEELLQKTKLSESVKNRIVLLDGKVQWELSTLSEEWKSVVSNAAELPYLQDKLGLQSSQRGGVFALLNGALFQETLAVTIPENVQIEAPLHLLYLSRGDTEGSNVSAPRLYIKCEKNSKIEIVEEFLSLTESTSSYLTLPLCEIDLLEDSMLTHNYAQLDDQAAKSSYSFVESNIGGQLSRHDMNIHQEGQETQTELFHFHLSGEAQVHDLHSKVNLNHQYGVVNQLHKCIVASSSGSGVFDGNVKVNRFAQKTDAGQLSRSLLLAPKATINAKPNLQIIADDVKCTHGCTVSDLSDEEVFYFRARGIDQETAREALVFSFCSEINQKFKSKDLKERVEHAVLERLNRV